MPEEETISPAPELVNKEMLVGTFIDLCPFGTEITKTGGTDTVDESFKPAKESKAWLPGGEVIDYKITPATEDDARTAFSRATKSYVTRKNTKVTGNTIEVNVTEMNPLLWQIIYQTDRLEAGKEVQPFSRTRFGENMWARLTKYQEDKKEIMVLEVAALLKVELPTENNKLLTPKLTLEVIPSSLNSLTPTEEIAFPAPAGA